MYIGAHSQHSGEECLIHMYIGAHSQHSGEECLIHMYIGAHSQHSGEECLIHMYIGAHSQHSGEEFLIGAQTDQVKPHTNPGLSVDYFRVWLSIHVTQHVRWASSKDDGQVENQVLIDISHTTSTHHATTNKHHCVPTGRDNL
jgi:hypothetical protein